MRKKLTYFGGHSGKKGLIGILAFPNSISNDTEFTLFFMMFKNNWGHQKFNFEISSASYLWNKKANKKSWWLVGKRGQVVELTANNPVSINNIDTAGTGKGKYGYLSKISNIDNSLYICGYKKQVYKQENGKWNLISKNILDQNNSITDGFEDITGHDEKNIYAVGDSGIIWHFDGKKWHDSNSPTNQNLSSICCNSKKEYWICGDNGVIIKGKHDNWSIIPSNEDLTDDWWDIEFFQNEVYLIGDSILAKLTKDNDLEEVKIPDKNNYIPVSLTQSENVLWVIGEDSIFSFDGKKWQEHVCPDM